MLRFPAIVVIGTVAIGALSGCESRDPYLRTDVWRPTGANAANIAAMVADPHDMISGRGVVRKDTKAPELAVEHIWSDQPKPLLGGGGGGGSSSGGSGGGGSSGGS